MSWKVVQILHIEYFMYRKLNVDRLMICLVIGAFLISYASPFQVPQIYDGRQLAGHIAPDDDTPAMLPLAITDRNEDYDQSADISVDNSDMQMKRQLAENDHQYDSQHKFIEARGIFPEAKYTTRSMETMDPNQIYSYLDSYRTETGNGLKPFNIEANKLMNQAIFRQKRGNKKIPCNPRFLKLCSDVRSSNSFRARLNSFMFILCCIVNLFWAKCYS